MNKRIEIDPSAGVCFGVEKAIETAEAALSKGDTVYGLGAMVHNKVETDRLEQLGLRTIGVEDFSKIAPARVVLRAHGEPPSTYKAAKEQNVELIDATCPIVLKLQERIRKRFREMDPTKEQIVIFGKAGHPESIGLVGQTGGKAILVSGPRDIGKVDPGKKTWLYSQTTMDPDAFRELEKALEKHTGEGIGEGAGGMLKSHCTVCSQMKRRKPDLEKFARQHDLVLFVSGRNSSNGEMLYRYCRDWNPATKWIHSAEDVKAEWLGQPSSIGISGATSTPLWQLEEVRAQIEKLLKEAQ